MTGIERGFVLKKTISRFVNVEGSTILDVGSGNGGISIAFGKHKNTRVFGIDLDTNRAKTSKIGAEEKKATANFFVADGLNLPFKTSFFDLIICNDVIEHVQKPQQLLKELHRCLRNGGFLYLCAPNGLSPYSIFQDAHYGLFGLSLMSHRLGKFYVTKIRKINESYDVYGPFTYWRLRVLLGSMYTVVDCYNEQNEHPNRVKRLTRYLPDIFLRLFFPVIPLLCERK